MIVEYKRKEDTFNIREGSSDSLVVDECYSKMYVNERTNYNSKDIVLDVGCNIGAFSTRVSPLVDRIIAYEPEPENYNLALQNLLKNNRPNVYVNNAALVGSDIREISFYVNVMKNKGLHSTIPARGRDEIKVRAVKFSEALKESHANKIKLDVEGAEWEIFNNDRDIDWSKIDNIIMEWHQQLLKDKDQSKFDWVVNYLQQHFPNVHAPRPTLKSWTSIIFASKT